MKKKWVVLGSAIGISTVVMATTGITALAGTSGYENYKEALKNSKTAKSVSVQAEVVLQDNGTTLNNATGSLKINLTNETASGTVAIAGQNKKQSLDLFKQSNQTVWKASDKDVYYVKSEKKEKKREKNNDPNEQDSAWMSKQAETVIDALVGNLQNEVVSDKNTDGSEHISMKLSNAQIPAVLQALAPLAFKQLSENHHEGKRASDAKEGSAEPDKLLESSLFKPSQLSLTQDIQITNVSLQADIDANNFIKNQQFSVTFSGKDASSVNHDVTINVNAQLSNYNATTPDTIDLKGKNVQQVKNDHGHSFDEQD
ncbi:hypothetical protein Back11_20550 [Paenibacillus baekrokdamisoli]|uniref:Uncharacterized protein n=1 Tax=Paenibacillus baekrokdamisoli TaxID=1712516 RepID=A0A3G9IPC1_9BACL|nr:hypothetical protein [Paenibacillus baekrokdamisoli]MBB3069937.1 hypothetical protein [Paenibacillus baekrokdamisoli]BBH20710.1 hypothetical protein Back11_20550 [Paenibacillus baekrokdamisoli]